MGINVSCCEPVCFYHARHGVYHVYNDYKHVCLICNDDRDHGFYEMDDAGSHDGVCSDDDKL